MHGFLVPFDSDSRSWSLDKVPDFTECCVARCSEMEILTLLMEEEMQFILTKGIKVLQEQAGEGREFPCSQFHRGIEVELTVKRLIARPG